MSSAWIFLKLFQILGDLAKVLSVLFSSFWTWLHWVTGFSSSEMEWSTYGFSQALRYHLELNWTEEWFILSGTELCWTRTVVYMACRMQLRCNPKVKKDTNWQKCFFFFVQNVAITLNTVPLACDRWNKCMFSSVISQGRTFWPKCGKTTASKWLIVEALYSDLEVLKQSKSEGGRKEDRKKERVLLPS